MSILVTGAAGFIGFHVARRLLEEGETVVGYDAVTTYYDPRLKRDRLALLAQHPQFVFVEDELENTARLGATIAAHRPRVVLHLAAQAGVRYSIENPAAYMSANLQGTFSLLDVLRDHPPEHLLFASTSSIYGANPKQPFRELDRTDYPVSLYAATKRGCEALSHSYAQLYGIPITCFRFFTVYGPWGRPDMALFTFVRRMQAGEAIDVYGDGQMHRDFTYIDDLVASILALIDRVPVAGEAVSVNDSISPTAPWRVVNLAGGAPRSLSDFIAAIEQRLGVTAVRNVLPMQPGDVVGTHADPSLLRELTGVVPSTPLEQGVDAFITWYERHYGA